MSGTACRKVLDTLNREPASHAGLLLARYLRVPVKEEKEHPAERRKLFEHAIAACRKAGPVYRLAFERWVKEVNGDACGQSRSQGRIVVGLGGENVLEAGITLHHTYGVPYLPGPALKGLASHYCDRVWGEGIKEYKKTGKHFLELFGTSEDSGHVTFHDAWLEPGSLSEGGGLHLDVMTPHHADYYAGKPHPPGDFDDPNPVAFLSVTGTFRVFLTCDVADSGQRKAWAVLAMNLLEEAMKEWGIGGKTNAGYGRLEKCGPTSTGDDQTASPDTPRMFHKTGDRVTVTRKAHPKGTDKPWFLADDGFGGTVTAGAAPDVSEGEETVLWVTAVNRNSSYNFQTTPPKEHSAPDSRKKGPPKGGHRR